MSDFERIETVIRFLEEHRSEQPDLEELANHVGLSRFHLQRMFSQWAGITPKGFLKALNLVFAKSLLQSGESVLSTALNTGLSGPSRLHDLCVTLEAASPGEIKAGGRGWTIRCGFAESPFGTCLVGENHRGLCHLSFVPSDSVERAAEAVRGDWPEAEIVWDHGLAESVVASAFVRSSVNDVPAPLKTFVRGTDFQVRVWRALLEIPHGELTSYSRLAQSVGKPSATRAVASAVAKNRLAYLIPCHRVIRETGVIGKYRWGRDRKIAIVAWEQAAAESLANRVGDPNG